MKIFNNVNILFIGIYKIIGYALLAFILLGIFAYLFVSIFYMIDKRWVAPIILTEQSEEVIKINSQFIQYKYARDKILIERIKLMKEINRLEQVSVLKIDLVKQLDTALNENLKIENERLAMISFTLSQYDVDSTIDKELEKSFKTSLIKTTDYVQQKQSLIMFNKSKDDLNIEKKQIQNIVSSYENLTKKKICKISNYEVLKMREEYLAALQETNNNTVQIEIMKEELKSIDSSIDEYDKICVKFALSPYIRALDTIVAIAFVPYTNLKSLKINSYVYGGSFEFFFSKKVGQVKKILSGEIAVKHPLFNKQIRGIVIELDLVDMRWARNKTLFVGSKPLFVL